MGDVTLPDVYASGLRTRLRARWNDPTGLAVRRFAPVVFPGAPPEALLAFTAGAHYLYEDTATNPNSGFDQHEIGFWQVPAGNRNFPAASGYAGDKWSSLARGELVLSMLGRAAVTGPSAWKNAPEDQAAVGLAMLASDLAGAAAAMPASIRPRRGGHNGLGWVGSQWAVALAFDAFSTGPSRAGARAAKYQSALAQQGEDRRFAAWVSAYVADLNTGAASPGGGVHTNPAYDLLRVWQKLACGTALARDTGGDRAWFDLGLSAADSAAAQAILRQASSSQSTTKTAIQVIGSMPTAAKVGIAVAAGVALALVADELDLL